MEKINIAEKFSIFNDLWNPKIIAELNGQQIKLAKVKGSFIWHNHTHEDELFYIIKGCLKIELHDQTITLNAGEMFVVPKGIQHKPYAEEETWIMLFEPSITKHTGDITHEITVEKCEKI